MDDRTYQNSDLSLYQGPETKGDLLVDLSRNLAARGLMMEDWGTLKETLVHLRSSKEPSFRARLDLGILMDKLVGDHLE